MIFVCCLYYYFYFFLPTEDLESANVVIGVIGSNDVVSTGWSRCGPLRVGRIVARHFVPSMIAVINGAFHTAKSSREAPTLYHEYRKGFPRVAKRV